MILRKSLHGAPPGNEESQGWKPLQLFNLYRLTLSGLFVLSSLGGPMIQPLGYRFPDQFLNVSIAYFVFAAVSLISIYWHKPEFFKQVYIQSSVDIFAMTVLMFASGGVSSGLGVLLIVAVAGGSILMASRSAVFFAAMASIAVLVEEIFGHLSGTLTIVSFTQAGMLGASFFATAVLAHVLSRRIRESEALAAQRGTELATMEQLTEYVIQRMQTGIIVLDQNNRIRLINESAAHLLGISKDVVGSRLDDLEPGLAENIRTWRNDDNYIPTMFRASPETPGVIPRFAELGSGIGTLIFVEDTAIMAQQAQQLKLASLGRLTASIAHEIRNPLGAISHAGQLLAESDYLEQGDLRLTQIIREQSNRMNAIVESILQLSRRERAQPEEVSLGQWLENFRAEFARIADIDEGGIAVKMDADNIYVRFDTGQLHQVMWNLCNNALQHGDKELSKRKTVLHAGLDRETNHPYLEVIDSGKGLDRELAQQIFEPFFTTDPKGTGLGLYIARELCEMNQARLDYIHGKKNGGCFRITFADPRRKQIT
jgi:two-component system sensor histidine kinase PilS (NtrC family)